MIRPSLWGKFGLKGVGVQVLEIHRLGAHPLIQFFLGKLGVVRILDKHIHSNRDGTLSHGEAIGLLIHNVLVSRDPLYRLRGAGVALRGQGRCAIVGGVPPIEALLSGTPDAVRAASRESLAAGVHILDPGCSIPPRAS